MTISLIENLLGFVYNVCFVSCYWPQIIKSLRTKSVKDVSIALFIISIVGYMSATAYAVIRFGLDFWLLANYVLSGFSAAFMVYVYYRYK
jgi:uncharacterized protein with PQ loop repeat